MSSAASSLLFLLLLVAALSFSDCGISSFVGASSDDELVSELKYLRSRSPSGVIHLTDSLVTRFISSASTPRPFHFLIFFDAAHLHSKTDLHLPQLRSQFGLLSSSFLQNLESTPDDADSLFFADIEFSESKHSFTLFGVSSLPHVRLVRPTDSSLSDAVQMDQMHFARLAESMAEFVESRTGLSIGPIRRPPPLSRTQVIVLAIILLASLPFIVKKVIAGDTLVHDSKMWAVGAVFVYFFSVSGGMFGIIRSAPMFLQNRNDPNKLVFFYEGSGMQLGSEGFAIGGLYTLVGLLLAFVTHGLVRLKSLNAQRIVLLATMVISWWAVGKVIALDNWKTGYRIHAFYPRSWGRK